MRALGPPQEWRRTAGDGDRTTTPAKGKKFRFLFLFGTERLTTEEGTLPVPRLSGLGRRRFEIETQRALDDAITSTTRCPMRKTIGRSK